MEAPDKLYSRSFPRKQDVFELLEACQRLQVSQPTVELFRQQAAYPPDLRLAMNLKLILGLMVCHEITNILQQGLTQEERRALMELDMSGMSVKNREVAHGLLNVHERWLLLKKFSEVFRKATSFPDDYIAGHSEEPLEG